MSGLSMGGLSGSDIRRPDIGPPPPLNTAAWSLWEALGSGMNAAERGQPGAGLMKRAFALFSDKGTVETAEDSRVAILYQYAYAYALSLEGVSASRRTSEDVRERLASRDTVQSGGWLDSLRSVFGIQPEPKLLTPLSRSIQPKRQVASSSSSRSTSNYTYRDAFGLDPASPTRTDYVGPYRAGAEPKPVRDRAAASRAAARPYVGPYQRGEEPVAGDRSSYAIRDSRGASRGATAPPRRTSPGGGAISDRSRDRLLTELIKKNSSLDIQNRMLSIGRGSNTRQGTSAATMAGVALATVGGIALLVAVFKR